jgi:hypothetical protein
VPPARGHKHAPDRRGPAGGDQGVQSQVREAGQGVGIEKTAADFATRKTRLLDEQHPAPEPCRLPGRDGSRQSGPHHHDIPQVTAGIGDGNRVGDRGLGLHLRFPSKSGMDARDNMILQTASAEASILSIDHRSGQ